MTSTLDEAAGEPTDQAAGASAEATDQPAGVAGEVTDQAAGASGEASRALERGAVDSLPAGALAAKLRG